MKTSAVLASLFFGSFAVAAPVDKRALVYKTEVVTEIVVVYTTVFDDAAVPEATTTPAGYFYEQPKAPSSAVAQPTSQAPANPPVQSQAPSAAPAPQAPSSPAAVEQVQPVQSQPAPSSAAPAPAASSYAPAPAASSAAPAPATPSQPATGNPSAQTYTGEITIYDNNAGGSGACGTKLTDTDMIVALAQPTWGKSTYDLMTGAATNPWCGQKVEVHYNGKSIIATIMDLCPTCNGADLDLSLSAWKALTGLDEKTRLKGATWNKVS